MKSFYISNYGCNHPHIDKNDRLSMTKKRWNFYDFSGQRQ